MPALLCVSTVFLHQNSFSQAPGLNDATAWVVGPAKVALPDGVELSVPAGYKFARQPLSQNTAMPADFASLPGLLGLMTSETGDGWKIAVQFEKMGLVRADAAPSFDKNALLKSFQQENKSAKIAWEIEPSYDPAAHRVQYAVRLQTADRIAKEYVAQTLGRYGVLRALVLFQGAAAPDDLRQVAQVIFKKGFAYEDFQSGDRKALVRVADLPAHQSLVMPGSTEPAAVAKAAAAGRMMVFWVGFPVLVIGGAIILTFVWRKSKKEPLRLAPEVSQAPAQARPTLMAAAAAVTAAPARPAAAAELLGSEHNKPLPAPVAVRPKLGPTPMPNGSSNGSKGNNGFRKPLRAFSASFKSRRKEFDYNRYFADLMATVSGHAGMVEKAPAGYAVELTRLGNGSSTAGLSASASANSELIANQTTLIEEQRRLIQEQTRLIEEKAKLIAEKNQLLKLQAQMLEGKEL